MNKGQEFIEYIKTKLPVSGKNTKLIESLSKMVGVETSYALISQLGVGDDRGKASKEEIELIAYMLEPYVPLEIESFDIEKKPISVVLKGVGPEGSVIRVFPQYQLSQDGFDGKTRKWSIDVLVQCSITVNNEEFSVSGIALEYDGHDAHFRDHNIERSYLRDMSIMQSTAFLPFHVTKETWKVKKLIVQNSLVRTFSLELEQFFNIYNKAFEQGVKSASKNIEYALVNNLSQEVDLPTLTMCPKCTGKCSFDGGIDCDYCKGMGSVNESLAKNYNPEKDGYIECACSGRDLDCPKCGGSGRIYIYS